MEKIIVLIIGMLLFSGCHICKEAPLSTSIGKLDTSKQNASLTTNFICPKNIVGFTLVSHDNMGAEKEYCSNIRSSLITMLEIKDKSTDKIILNQTFSQKNMSYTNWHTPSTSFLLETEINLSEKLIESKEYTFNLLVEQSANNYKEIEVFMHWLDKNKDS